ncbi:MAG: hypothetical protein PHN69_07630 [Candidatus Pacebacteria bacterium]|nr:hypothetical protein [Candidatus Paceibacterota bacterium]
MNYAAPPSNNFLKNSLGTDSSIIRGELSKIELETAEIRQLIGTGTGYADAVYIGNPTLSGSWKIESILDVDHSELKLFRKSANGVIADNWVQYGTFPREYGELTRYNGSTPRTLTEQNTWYPSIGLSQGLLEEMEFVAGASSDNYLKISGNHGGVYKITWTTSMYGTTGKTFEMAISVGNVVQTNSISRKKMGSQDVGPFVGTCILQLNDGDEIRVVTRCIDAANQTVTFVHSNVNVVRL